MRTSERFGDYRGGFFFRVKRFRITIPEARLPEKSLRRTSQYCRCLHKDGFKSEP